MIKFENVTFAYGEKPVLKDFSLEIRKGDCICFFGESGKGKTTLLRLICGLERPSAGEITGTDKKRFSVVFQEDRLLSHLSVLENVSLVGREDKANELLCILGLEEYLDKKIGDLSGGMKRRVAIARALCADFDVLLLDEAFNGLDEDRIKDTAALILEQARGKTVIMITHSPSHAKLLNATVIHI